MKFMVEFENGTCSFFSFDGRQKDKAVEFFKSKNATLITKYDYIDNDGFFIGSEKIHLKEEDKRNAN